MRVGGDEADAAHVPAPELVEEARPERYGIGGVNFHAEHLMRAVGVNAQGGARVSPFQDASGLLGDVCGVRKNIIT